jgi:hypothetical protein
MLGRWIAIVGLLTRCAGHTAQQDMVYRAWADCRAEGRIAGQAPLARVEPTAGAGLSERLWGRGRPGVRGRARGQGEAGPLNPARAVVS